MNCWNFREQAKNVINKKHFFGTNSFQWNGQNKEIEEKIWQWFYDVWLVLVKRICLRLNWQEYTIQRILWLHSCWFYFFRFSATKNMSDACMCACVHCQKNIFFLYIFLWNHIKNENKNLLILMCFFAIFLMFGVWRWKCAKVDLVDGCIRLSVKHLKTQIYLTKSNL